MTDNTQPEKTSPMITGKEWPDSPFNAQPVEKPVYAFVVHCGTDVSFCQRYKDEGVLCQDECYFKTGELKVCGSKEVDKNEKPDFEAKVWDLVQSFYGDNICHPIESHDGLREWFKNNKAKVLNPIESLQEQNRNLTDENNLLKSIDVYRSASDYLLEISRHKSHIDHLKSRIKELETKI